MYRSEGGQTGVCPYCTGGFILSIHSFSPAACWPRELGATSAEVLAQLRYDLPATMKFHK